MSITFPTTALKVPNGITALPSEFKRPAFGTLYGFDAQQGGGASFIIYEINNSGTTFVLRSNGTVDYTVDWGDGSSETSTSNALSHTYSAGTYTLKISSDIAYGPDFAASGDEDQITSVEVEAGIDLGTTLHSAWNGAQNMTTFTASSATSTVTVFGNSFMKCSGLTSFPLIDTSSGTDFSRAWQQCGGLTSFPVIDTSSGTNFSQAWYLCTSLTSFPTLNMSSGTTFVDTWRQMTGLTSFPSIDVSSGTNFTNAWYGCSSLTSFPTLDTSSGTNFYQAWRGCTSLTSFPLIDTSSGTSFKNAWYSCSGLTSFAAIDTSSGTNFREAWRDCSGLTSFPTLDTSSGTDFYRAWYGVSGIGSFPSLDFSSGTSFKGAWLYCGSVTFPANLFDTTGTLTSTAFTNSWLNGALSAQSIENILVSLNANGSSSIALTLSGGSNAAKSTWSATAVTAYNALVGKSWSIAFNP